MCPCFLTGLLLGAVALWVAAAGAVWAGRGQQEI